MQTVTNRSCFRSIFRIRSPPLTGGPRARHRRRERFPMEDRLLNAVRNCASSSALEVAGSLRAALDVTNFLSTWPLATPAPSLPLPVGGRYTNVTECGASGFAPVASCSTCHHAPGGFSVAAFAAGGGHPPRERRSLFTGDSEGVFLLGRRPHARGLR